MNTPDLSNAQLETCILISAQTAIEEAFNSDVQRMLFEELLPAWAQADDTSLFLHFFSIFSSLPERITPPVPPATPARPRATEGLARLYI